MVETGTAAEYLGFAQLLKQHEATIEQLFHEVRNNGTTYPEQMNTVYQQVFKSLHIDLQSPNNILGLAYARANNSYNIPMNMHTLPRKHAGFHDRQIEGNIASATAIRKAILSKKPISEWQQTVPSATLAALEEHDLMQWENYWPLLKYQVLTSSLDELRGIYQVTEGLEYRLKECVQQATSFTHFVGKIKHKRITWVKIQRICTYILLQLTKLEVDTALKEVSYLRVLAFNKQGQTFLNKQKHQLQLPLITKVDHGNEDQLTLDIRAGEIYQMGKKNQTVSLDYYRKPMIV